MVVIDLSGFGHLFSHFIYKLFKLRFDVSIDGGKPFINLREENNI